MKKLLRLPMAAAILVFAMSGCAHKLEYTSYGELKPSADREVVKRWKAIEHPPSEGAVKVYLRTFPEGVRMDGSMVSVEKGSTRTVLGQFKWDAVGRVSEDEVSGELAKVAKAAGGNEVVILEMKISRKLARSASGFILLNVAPKATQPVGI